MSLTPMILQRGAQARPDWTQQQHSRESGSLILPQPPTCNLSPVVQFRSLDGRSESLQAILIDMSTRMDTLAGVPRPCATTIGRHPQRRSWCPGTSGCGISPWHFTLDSVCTLFYRSGDRGAETERNKRGRKCWLPPVAGGQVEITPVLLR